MNIEDTIWKYVDGTMDKEEIQVFEQKMNADRNLAETVQKIMQLHRTLAEQELLQPGPGFTDRVMHALPQSITRSTVLPRLQTSHYIYLLLSVLLIIGALIIKGPVNPEVASYLSAITIPVYEYGMVAGLGVGLLVLLTADQWMRRKVLK